MRGAVGARQARGASGRRTENDGLERQERSPEARRRRRGNTPTHPSTPSRRLTLLMALSRLAARRRRPPPTPGRDATRPHTQLDTRRSPLPASPPDHAPRTAGDLPARTDRGDGGRAGASPPSPAGGRAGADPRAAKRTTGRLAGRTDAACRPTHVNDPSAGSPTETLLRLLLPLDSQVRPSSQRSARAVGRPRRGRSEGLTKPSNR